MDRIERLRHQDLNDFVDRAIPEIATGTLRQLVCVYNGGAMPAEPDHYYLTNPTYLNGAETEGGIGSLSVDTSQTIVVNVLGKAPMAGDYLTAYAVGGRWVAELTTTQTGKGCIQFLGCNGQPLQGVIVKIYDHEGGTLLAGTDVGCERTDMPWPRCRNLLGRSDRDGRGRFPTRQVCLDSPELLNFRRRGGLLARDAPGGLRLLRDRLVSAAHDAFFDGLRPDLHACSGIDHDRGVGARGGHCRHHNAQCRWRRPLRVQLLGWRDDRDRDRTLGRAPALPNEHDIDEWPGGCLWDRTLQRTIRQFRCLCDLPARVRGSRVRHLLQWRRRANRGSWVCAQWHDW